MSSVYNSTLITPPLPNSRPTPAVFQAMLVIGVVATVFSILALLSQGLSEPSLSKIREITTQAGAFFGTDGMTFSAFIFSFSASGAIGGACGCIIISYRPSQKPKEEPPVKTGSVSTEVPKNAALNPGAPLLTPPKNGKAKRASKAKAVTRRLFLANAFRATLTRELEPTRFAPGLRNSSSVKRLSSPKNAGAPRVASKVLRRTVTDSFRAQLTRELEPSRFVAAGNAFKAKRLSLGQASRSHVVSPPETSSGSGGARAIAAPDTSLVPAKGTANRVGLVRPPKVVEISLGNTKLLIDLAQVTEQTLSSLFGHLQAAHRSSPHAQTALVAANQPQLSAEVVHALLAQTALLEEDFVDIPVALTAHIPKGNLLDYVNQFCPTYTSTFEALVAKGKTFVESFAKTKKGDAHSPEATIEKEKRREYGAPFVWYLMCQAQTQQGKGFEEGMFVLPDEGYRIHDFFAATATPRASSHYKQSRLTSYGMDIVQDGRTGLPGGHQTMHFGKRHILDSTKTPYIYVKPESWGTESWSQMAGHALSYLLTRVPHFLGMASQAGQFKEHTPAKCLKSFKALIAKIAPREKAPIREWGVAGMVHFLRDFLVKAEADGVSESEMTKHRNLIGQFLRENNLTRQTGTAATQGEEVVIASQEEVERLNTALKQLLHLLKPPAERTAANVVKSPILKG